MAAILSRPQCADKSLLCKHVVICHNLTASIGPVDLGLRHMAAENQTSTDSVLQQSTWWRHQMETFSALLAICAGTSPASGEFPTQKPVTRSFDVFFDLCLNKCLRKQSWGWWFETLSRPLWRHCNEYQTSSGTSHIVLQWMNLCSRNTASGFSSNRCSVSGSSTKFHQASLAIIRCYQTLGFQMRLKFFHKLFIVYVVNVLFLALVS